MSKEERYQVSALQFRPSTFNDVVGQSALTKTLKHSIQQGNLAHAYLFCGPRGVGKTTCARIFAKAINCQHLTSDGEPCNECESCKAMNEQASFNVIELDAASNNSVDDIRELIRKVQVPPMIGEYSVYIIDEVHMLSQAAFNAFLKTLEEPPKHAIFVMATTEKHKVLPTIISRCQVYDFEKITVQDIVSHLTYVASKRGVKIEKDAAQIIAVNADGGMRDSLSIFDQVASFSQGNITVEAVNDNLNLLSEAEYFKLLAFVLQSDRTRLMLLVDELMVKGFEPAKVMRGYASFLRNVLMAQDQRTVSLVETSDSILNRYIKAGQACAPALLWQWLKVANQYDTDYKDYSDKRLALEVSLLKMCEISGDPTLILTAPQRPVNLSAGYNKANSQAAAVTNNTSTSKPDAPSNNPANKSSQEPATNSSTAEQVQGYSSNSSLSAQRPSSSRKSSSRATARTKKNLGFSLTGNQNEEEEENSSASTLNSQNLRSSSFTEAELHSAWREFANALQSQTLLKQTLRDHLPAFNPDDITNITVTFPTQQQAQKTIEMLDDITKFLMQQLQNDNIRIKVLFDKTKGNDSLPISSEEKMAYFSARSDWFSKIVNELGFEPST